MVRQVQYRRSLDPPSKSLILSDEQSDKENKLVLDGFEATTKIRFPLYVDDEIRRTTFSSRQHNSKLGPKLNVTCRAGPPTEGAIFARCMADS